MRSNPGHAQARNSILLRVVDQQQPASGGASLKNGLYSTNSSDPVMDQLQRVADGSTEGKEGGTKLWLCGAMTYLLNSNALLQPSEENRRSRLCSQNVCYTCAGTPFFELSAGPHFS